MRALLKKSAHCLLCAALVMALCPAMAFAQERACCPGRESNHAAVQDARKPSAQVAIPPVRARFPSILPFTASMTRTRTASSPKKASRAAIAPSKREGSRPLATRVILVFAGRFRQSPLPSPRF